MSIRPFKDRKSGEIIEKRGFGKVRNPLILFGWETRIRTLVDGVRVRVSNSIL